MKQKIIEIINNNYDVIGGNPKLNKEQIAIEILDLFCDTPYFSNLKDDDKSGIHEVLYQLDILKLVDDDKVEKYYEQLPYEIKKDGMRWGFSDSVVQNNMANWFENNEQKQQEFTETQMGYDKLLSVIISGCKFKYYSYDHKQAMNEYRTNPEYEVVRKWIPNPNSYDMPNKLKDKYKTERIGKLRKIYFNPLGKAVKFKIGAKYAKTYSIKDFGVNVFPLV